jgi:hypothetical protein
MADHYTATLEGFIARFEDLAVRLREAYNTTDEAELVDLIDEFNREIERAVEFVQQEKRKRTQDSG